MRDIAASWMVLIIASVTAVIFGYLYLFVIRLVGGAIVWISIAVIEIALLASAVYTMMYRNEKFKEEEATYDYLTYAMYVLFGLTAVTLILVCCFWHAIKIGIAVFKTTSQYVQANLKIFILPIVSYLTIGVWSCFWLIGAVNVFSIGTPEPRDDGFPFATEVKWDWFTRVAFFYDIFGLFWINAFVIGVS
jgi:hypothetical protein